METIRIHERGEPESPVGDPLAPGALSALQMLDPNLTDITALKPTVASLWQTGLHMKTTPSPTGNRQPSLAMDLRKWTRHHTERLWIRGRSPIPPRTPRLAGKSFKTKQWLPQSPHPRDRPKQNLPPAINFLRPKPRRWQDTANRLLWRQNPRRMDAEPFAIQFSWLVVNLMIKEEVLDSRTLPTSKPMPPSIITSRRTVPNFASSSIYRFVVRTTPNRFMTTLDCPDPANFTPKGSTPLHRFSLLLCTTTTSCYDRPVTSPSGLKRLRAQILRSKSIRPSVLSSTARQMRRKWKFRSPCSKKRTFLFSAAPSSTQTNFSTSTRLKREHLAH